MAAELRCPARRRTAPARLPHLPPLLRRARAPALALLVVIAAALCLSWSTAPGPLVATLAPIAPAGAAPAARAASALAAMQSAYYVAFSGDFAATPGAWSAANLWSDSWALAALEDVAGLPGGSRYLPLVNAAASGLQAYWDAAARPPAYAPVAHAGPGIVTYYDDNAWVGLDLVAAFRLTGNTAYLRRAGAVMGYAATGWDQPDGGLWWSDRRTYRNTAANAATAELAAELYQATGDAADLTWAERIYAWQTGTLVTPAGRVADGVANDAQWTYNYGTVIAAGVALYQATGRKSYLTGAEAVATYALAHLPRADGTLPPPASFDGVLADGLLALWRVDHRADLAAALMRNAGLAWSLAQTSAGLFGDRLGGPAPTGTVALLTDSGVVRLLAAAAAVSGH